MKELVMVDGRIYLAEPIQANPLLEKTVAKIQLRFQKETFIKALEERMTRCENELAAAVANDSIINVGEHVITFFNEDKTAGRFIIPSFKAMESAIEKLQGVDGEVVDCVTLDMLLTRLELNQLKKALVTHIGEWDRGASAIEEIEFSKEWLQNWYKERLPILGLEHLLEQVDRGLNVPYQEVKAPYTKDQVKLPTYVAGKYILPGNRAPFRSGKRVKQPNGLVVIDTDMNDDWVETTAAHEYNHSIHFDETGRFNYDFIPGSPRLGSFTWSYYQQPWELHSLIMELRKLNNLDPKKTTYNKEDLIQIKNHDEMSKDILNNLLQYMSEDDVINALNTWAYNSKDLDAFKVRDNVYYAKKGQKLTNDDLAYEAFKKSLPRNLRDDSNYRMRYYWKVMGKPANWQEAQEREMFRYDPTDWSFHSVSVSPIANERGEYEFLKPKTHNTIGYEIGAYLHDPLHPYRNYNMALDVSGEVPVYRERKQGEYPFAVPYVKGSLDNIPMPSWFLKPIVYGKPTINYLNLFTND